MLNWGRRDRVSQWRASVGHFLGCSFGVDFSQGIAIQGLALNILCSILSNALLPNIVRQIAFSDLRSSSKFEI